MNLSCLLPEILVHSAQCGTFAPNKVHSFTYLHRDGGGEKGKMIIFNSQSLYQTISSAVSIYWNNLQLKIEVQTDLMKEHIPSLQHEGVDQEKLEF